MGNPLYTLNMMTYADTIHIDMRHKHTWDTHTHAVLSVR